MGSWRRWVVAMVGPTVWRGWGGWMRTSFGACADGVRSSTRSSGTECSEVLPGCPPACTCACWTCRAHVFDSRPSPLQIGRVPAQPTDALHEVLTDSPTNDAEPTELETSGSHTALPTTAERGPSWILPCSGRGALSTDAEPHADAAKLAAAVEEGAQSGVTLVLPSSRPAGLLPMASHAPHETLASLDVGSAGAPHSRPGQPSSQPPIAAGM